MTRIAAIDGDIVAYRCAAVNENADLGLAIWQTDQLLTRILEDINADDWKVYLSGENNFRYNLFADYKANRRNTPRPKHLEPIREYLVTDWQATIVDGYEADDALGIYSTNRRQEGKDWFICSIDKDLLQLPGKHYNFVRREIVEIDEIGGAKQFYTQLLVGDPTDNIRGCPGIGKVKAARIIEGCQSERELFEQVRDTYKRVYTERKLENWESDMNLNAQLLYILRGEDDQWKSPEQYSGQQ